MLKAENLFLILAGALLAIALGMGAWSWSETAATRNWRSVEGRVIDSRAQYQLGRSRYGQTLTWVPVVHYSFEASGRRLTGDRVYPGSPEEWADEAGLNAYLAATYPPGAAVIVHYNPDNPRLAALSIEGNYTWPLVLGGTGLLFLLIGIVMRPLIRRAPQ